MKTIAEKRKLYTGGRWVAIYYGNFFKCARRAGRYRQRESTELFKTLADAQTAADRLNAMVVRRQKPLAL